MVSKRAKSVVTKAVLIILLTMALLAANGCKSLEAVDYQFGDVSRSYCESTDEKLRKTLKAILSANGLTIGVDYCSTVGLVDALLLQPIQNKH